MPRPPNSSDNRPILPSRATSAFFSTVRAVLHERASDYIMWVAGHGGDTDTIRRYIQATVVFPSHFNEWVNSNNMTRTDLVLSLPSISTLFRSGVWPGDSYNNPPTGRTLPVPEIVATVATLAIQQHMLRQAQASGWRQIGGVNLWSSDSLSGHPDPVVAMSNLNLLHPEDQS